MSERSAPTFVLACALALAACSAPRGGEVGGPVLPARAMVVAEHPLAVAAGLEVLDAGGNAADAAVATALALAVVYPQAGNLGGGGFAIWVPEGRGDDALALDFRERAPRELVADDFLREDGEPIPGASTASHLAAGVPGTPAGLALLAGEHGLLPLERLAAPAVRLAREGFRVDAYLARDLAREDLRARLTQSAAARALFYPGGEPLAEGTRLRQPELARTLERFAREGADGFYTGPVAESLAAEMRRGSGRMDTEDLAGYEALWVEPLRGWFRGYEVITMPPPSSGGVLLLQALGILDGLPLESERERAMGDPDRPLEEGITERALHWWIEALRLAFADRAEHLGDPEFHDVPIDELLAAEWIAERRVSIGERADPDVAPLALEPVVVGTETTHLCVVDEEGNAVSLTTTLNSIFGAGILVPGGGFLLNNQMDDFALRPGVPNLYGLVGKEANAVAGRKRPLSTMTPTVLLADGRRVGIVIGSPGGPRILSSVLQVLLRVLVYGQDVEAAVRAPRLHQQWKPTTTLYERGWPTAVLAALRGRGHELDETDGPFASVQVIVVGEDGEPQGASDPRRGGVVGTLGESLPEPSKPGEFDTFF